jgi:hypothetical protein
MSGTRKKLNEILLNHIERLIIVNRDYITKTSKSLKTQYKWFMDKVDDMYDNDWIDLETYNKAMMGIEYLMNLNKEKKSAKEKN